MHWDSTFFLFKQSWLLQFNINCLKNFQVIVGISSTQHWKYILMEGYYALSICNEMFWDCRTGWSETLMQNFQENCIYFFFPRSFKSMSLFFKIRITIIFDWHSYKNGLICHESLPLRNQDFAFDTHLLFPPDRDQRFI